MGNAIILHEWEKSFFYCRDVTRFGERFIDVVVRRKLTLFWGFSLYKEILNQ